MRLSATESGSVNGSPLELRAVNVATYAFPATYGPGATVRLERVMSSSGTAVGPSPAQAKIVTMAVSTAAPAKAGPWFLVRDRARCSQGNFTMSRTSQCPPPPDRVIRPSIVGGPGRGRQATARAT